jgi:hypothetical protein
MYLASFGSLRGDKKESTIDTRDQRSETKAGWPRLI